MAENLGSQKELFQLAEGKVYMSAAGRTPLLVSAAEAGYEGVRKQLETPWNIGAAGKDRDDIRQMFATLINAPSADHIATCPSTSYVISIAAMNIQLLGEKKGRPVNTGSRILLLDGQMSSNVYPWQELCERTGAKLLVMSRKDHAEDWTDIILVQLSSDPTIAVVALPNVHWCDGSVIDLVKIGKVCREKTIHFVVDATQSLGVMPFDVQEVKPDFLAASVHKWLLGAYGCSLMFVSEEWWESSQPIEFHERTRINPNNVECFPFDKASDTHCYESTYLPGAAKFISGGSPNAILFPILRTSLQQVLSWGVPNIQATLMPLTKKIHEFCKELGLATPSNHSHIIGISHPHNPKWAEGAAKFLVAHNFMVVERLGYVRCAPYLYNTDEDIDLLYQLLKEYCAKEDTK